MNINIEKVRNIKFSNLDEATVKQWVKDNVYRGSNSISVITYDRSQAEPMKAQVVQLKTALEQCGLGKIGTSVSNSLVGRFSDSYSSATN